MKIAIMQPYLFPYLGYIQLISSVDLFIHFDDVNFIKKGWIHRNRILSNAQELQLLMPLVKMSQNKKISDTFIFEPDKSKEKIFKQIYQSYSKAPFATNWMPQVERWVHNGEQSIARYNAHILESIVCALQLKTQFKFSSEVGITDDLKGQDRIIALTAHFGATNYINAIGGMQLYDREKFSERNLQINFLKTKDYSYVQPGRSDFLPHLSILDVLFNAPLDKISELINNYDLL